MTMIFIVLITIYLVLNCVSGLCENSLPGNIAHLGTKTPYRLVAETNDILVRYPGCSPQKIVGIIRHGTRTPGRKQVRQMREVLSRLKEDFIRNDNIFRPNKLCDFDRRLLRNWTFSIETDGEKFLTREGGKEMYLLAKRLQNRFPSLLSEYSNETFLALIVCNHDLNSPTTKVRLLDNDVSQTSAGTWKPSYKVSSQSYKWFRFITTRFRFTKTQRTEESAKYFTSGLFGKRSKDVWFPEPKDPDPILRFYKLCPRWRTEVKKSKASTRERNKFIKSKEMQAVLRSISDRLGFNYTLAFGSVQTMYSACGFETAWYPHRSSPWCSLFKQSEIKLLEYAEELKYYWRDGYGFDINYRQSCPLFNNILEILKDEREVGKRAVFYFSHSGTLLKALSRLGLYRDPFVLRANLTVGERASRLWRVSRIDTFGTNIIFTLFKCSGDGDVDKVLLSHQERQAWLKRDGLCPPPPRLCPLSSFGQALGSHLDCDFEEICALPSPASPTSRVEG